MFEQAQALPIVGVENPVATSKKTTGRGRPFKWTPTPITEADHARVVTLKADYGPDADAHEAFLIRYDTFCELNKVDPLEGSSLLLCIGQALNGGMAMSSLATSVAYVGHKRRIRNYWYVKSLVKAGHADAPAVQPRNPLMPEEGHLSRVINKMAQSNIVDGVLLWLLWATGGRCACIYPLPFGTIRLS